MLTRESIDLHILLQEKDTLLAEKEESARLANSMENIACTQATSFIDHRFLMDKIPFPLD